MYSSDKRLALIDGYEQLNDLSPKSLSYLDGLGCFDAASAGKVDLRPPLQVLLSAADSARISRSGFSLSTRRRIMSAGLEGHGSGCETMISAHFNLLGIPVATKIPSRRYFGYPKFPLIHSRTSSAILFWTVMSFIVFLKGMYPLKSNILVHATYNTRRNGLPRRLRATNDGADHERILYNSAGGTARQMLRYIKCDDISRQTPWYPLYSMTSFFRPMM